MRRQLPRVRAGDIISASKINALFDEARRLNLTVGPGLLMAETKGGMALTATCGDQIFIRITGAAVTLASGMVAYPWTQLVPVVDGAWEDSAISGTAAVSSGVPTDDPAIESTGNDDVPLNRIVIATRVLGVLGFSYRACGS